MITQGVEREFQQLYEMSKDADTPITAQISPLKLGDSLNFAVVDNRVPKISTLCSRAAYPKSEGESNSIHEIESSAKCQERRKPNTGAVPDNGPRLQCTNIHP
jgi:hypothetical protein